MGPIGKRLTAGILFVAIGAFFALEAWFRLPMGTTTEMGPGYFPFALALVLIAVGGSIVLFQTASAPREILGDVSSRLGVSWRSLLLISAAPILFAFAVDDLGLAPALLLVTFTASFASRHMRIRQAALLAVAITAFCVTVFAYGLDLPIPIVGQWMGK